ncbi:MAG: IS66 family transposase [bacterium]|nr:IS66 family transposase [bacterium]MCP4437157.1 IS66 family transposase [Actinomycetes bacterium]MCP4797358.1 IS66 family transposase [Phycisphaeraceae bacterium]MCP4851831.1 IS66 family transposase [Actinomycetes bacterium]
MARVSQAAHDDLRRQLDAVNARNAELTAEVSRLAQLVAVANEQMAELLAIVGRKKRGGRKSTAKAPEPPPTVSEEERRAYAERPRAPARPKKVKPPKKPRRPTGRKPLPEHLLAEEHTLRPEACSDCGGTDLELVDEVIETKLHVVQEHQRRRVVRRKTCACRHCGTRTTARSLPSPFARSKATCEWLAWLVHQKFVMLTPLDRLRRDLASRGLPLAMSYLVSQIERAADLLGPVDGEHWKQLLAGEWMATDATGLKVLVPKVGSHNGHLEVYRRDDLVNFQYEAHKGAQALADKLVPFSGLLVADAEHRHNLVFEDGSVLEAGCNAHGRRKFRDAEVSQPVLAKEGGEFISAIYIEEATAQKEGLRGDALQAWRQLKVPPLRDALLAWMDAVELTLTPDDALAKVIRYYRNHWSALFRFVDHPEIPIDNSASEREYQHVAKLRLNSLFAGSTEGAHRAATLLGVAATCRALGVDTLAYLSWAFTRLGTHRDLYGLSAAELTPAAFARARAGPEA